MPRTRSLKPGFFKNEQLAKLPFQWRLLYEGLWTQADRAGRLEDRPVRLKAELFPYDDLEIEEGLARLADAHFITRYEVNGLRYIAIPTFGKHQSPHVNEAESEFPSVPRHRSSTRVAPESHHASTSGTGTSTGTSTSTSTALRARFDRFWQAYPKHVGEDAAWIVWKQRRPNEELTQEILAAVARQRQSAEWQRDDGQFIPNPKTWLHQGRWKDKTEPARPTQKPNGRAARVPDRDLEQARKTQEVHRLIREEGLTRAQALEKVGYR